MKKIIITSLLIIFCLVLIIPAQAALINGEKKTDFDNNIKNVLQDTDYSYTNTRDIENIIAIIIRLVLSLIGAIFLVLIFVAGNQWMQAAGNEEKIKKSKARIQSAIIGLLIVLIAYALSSGFSSLLTTLVNK